MSDLNLVCSIFMENNVSLFTESLFITFSQSLIEKKNGDLLY